VKHRKNFLDWIALITITWCFFSPKISLIDYGTSNIRIDDFLIFFLFLLFLLYGLIARTKIPNQIQPFLLFLLFSFLSSIYNGMVDRVDTITALVFSLRNFEYFLFFYFGVYLARRRIELYPILKYYLLFTLVLVFLQMTNLISSLSSFISSFSLFDSTTRAVGNTNGPYELAILSAFMSYYFYLHNPNSKFMAFFSAVILFVTSSRSTGIGYLIVVANRYRTQLIIALPLIVAGFAFILSMPSVGDKEPGGNDLLSRFFSLLSVDLIYELLYSSGDITPVNSSQEYANSYFTSSSSSENIQSISGDVSAYIRFYRWLVLIKSSFAHLDSIFIGLGPSFGTAAVDGFYVRLLIETGIVGLLLYLWFIARCLKYESRHFLTFKYFIVTMLFTAFGIDIFFSYKPMILFWLYLGFIYKRHQK
jgi:hypothetical protein